MNQIQRRAFKKRNRPNGKNRKSGKTSGNEAAAEKVFLRNHILSKKSIGGKRDDCAIVALALVCATVWMQVVRKIKPAFYWRPDQDSNLEPTP